MEIFEELVLTDDEMERAIDDAMKIPLRKRASAYNIIAKAQLTKALPIFLAKAEKEKAEAVEQAYKKGLAEGRGDNVITS